MSKVFKLSPSSAQYPVMAFPPIAVSAICSVQKEVKAPWALVAMSALTMMSLSVQASTKVKRPDGVTTGVGLFTLTVGNSGERKTAVEAKFMPPFLKFEQKWRKLHEIKLKEFEVDCQIWQTMIKGLNQALERGTKDGEDTTVTQEKLKDLYQVKPEKPVPISLLFQDASPAAMSKRLNRFASAGWISSEGSSILEGRVMREMSFLNDLWSGILNAVDRMDRDTPMRTDASLTIGLQIQPALFSDFLQAKGTRALESGLLARYLCFYPESTVGTRHDRGEIIDPHGLDFFNQRAEELLNAAVDENGALITQHLTLEFTQEAQLDCRDFANYIERHSQLGGLYADVRAAASKTIDQMARIASIFHRFSGQEGDISVQTTRNAITIAEAYLVEHKRLFGKADQVPTEPDYVTKSKILLQWLYEKSCHHIGYRQFTLSDLARCGPRKLRQDKLLRQQIIDFLLNQGSICSFSVGKSGLGSAIALTELGYAQIGGSSLRNTRSWVFNGLPTTTAPYPSIDSSRMFPMMTRGSTF
jgi:Protein of unknown function (DUF3987)